MQFSITAALLSATVLHTAAASPLKGRAAEPEAQVAQPVAVCTGPGGPVPDPAGAAPKRVVVQDSDVKAGTQRIKLRHGPFLAPGMTKKSIRGEHGALWNCGVDVEKPCEECTVLRIVAGMEYPNGTNANIDTGMWMHHMVALNSGPGRWDPTCHKDNFSMPHLVVGAEPTTSERFFASGNERSVIDFRKSTVEGKNAGYHLRPEDQFKFIVDLMNMNMDDRVMYLTMTYDIIDGPIPADYLSVKPIWLDADQCNLSEVEVEKDAQKLVIASIPWTPDVEGRVITSGGHLHDGGVTAGIYASKDRIACDSSAKYSESAEFVFKDTDGMGAGIAPNHISSMKICNAEDMPNMMMNNTQSWYIDGDYDYTKHAGNFEDGKAQDIMAIALIYVAQPQTKFDPKTAVAPAPITGDTSYPGRMAEALIKINDGILETTKKLQAWNGDVIAASDILVDYNAFVANLNETTVYVSSFTPTSVEHVRMLKPTSAMLGYVKNLIDVLVAKQPIFEQQGLAFVVLDNIQSAMVSTSALTKKMAEIIPSKAKRVIDGVVDQIQAEVERGLKAYGGTPAAPSAEGDAHAETETAGMAGMEGMEGMPAMHGHGDMA